MACANPTLLACDCRRAVLCVPNTAGLIVYRAPKGLSAPPFSCFTLAWIFKIWKPGPAFGRVKVLWIFWQEVPPVANCIPCLLAETYRETLLQIAFRVAEEMKTST